jgi:spore maturation protein CgeB
MPVRILFLGENWFGSCARACAYAIRRLGCQVSDIDVQTYFPVFQSKALRIARRAAEPLILRDFNQAILQLAQQSQPDILLAFKGPYVLPSTLNELRRRGITLYNYFPDTSAFAHGDLLSETLPLYDCVFYTKRHWEGAHLRRLAPRASAFVAHGYDPEIHHSAPPDPRDQALGHDVTVVATHMPHKEEMLSRLVELRPNLDLRIWGSSWREKVKHAGLRRFVDGSPLLGSVYARALRSSKICLSIMSGPVRGSEVGDQTTTRSYEIPACGAFMLHERNQEIAGLYKEDQEVVLFSSPEELAEKIDFYLANPELRKTIAARGHRRCVPAYSYDARMREILAWDAAQHGAPGRTQVENSCLSIA